MSKKKYRIYKAGGEQGRVMNPTAQFLARAEMGMQQPSPEEMAMMQQQSMPPQSQQPMEGPESEEAQMMQQMVALIGEALQNGAKPEEVVAKLLQDQVPPEIVSEALIELGMPEAEVGSLIANVMAAPSEEEMMAMQQQQMQMAAEEQEGMPTEEQRAMATPTEDLTETASKGAFVKRKLKMAKEGMASNTNLAAEDNVNNVSSLIDFSKTNTLKNQYEQEYDQMMANQNMMPEARLGREARMQRREDRRDARQARRELRRDERAENRAIRQAGRANRQAQRAYRDAYRKMSTPFGYNPPMMGMGTNPMMIGDIDFERKGLFNYKLHIDNLGFPTNFSNGMLANAMYNPYGAPQGQQRITQKILYPGEIVDAKVVENNKEIAEEQKGSWAQGIRDKAKEAKAAKDKETGESPDSFFERLKEKYIKSKNDVKGSNIGTESSGSYSKTNAGTEEDEDQAGGEKVGNAYVLTQEDIEGDTLGLFEDTTTNVSTTPPGKTPAEGGDNDMTSDDALYKGIGVLVLGAAGWMIIKKTKKGYKKYKAKKLKNGKIKVGKPQAMSEAELEKMRKNEFFGKTKAKVQNWRNRIINKQYTSKTGKPINAPMSKYSGKFMKRPQGIRDYMMYQTKQTLGTMGRPFSQYGSTQRYFRNSKINPYSWKKPKIKLPKLGGPGGAALMGLPILYDMATQYEDGGFVDNNLYKFTGGGDYNYFEDGGYVGYEDITDPYMPTMEHGGPHDDQIKVVRERIIGPGSGRFHGSNLMPYFRDETGMPTFTLKGKLAARKAFEEGDVSRVGDAGYTGPYDEMMHDVVYADADNADAAFDAAEKYRGPDDDYLNPRPFYPTMFMSPLSARNPVDPYDQQLQDWSIRTLEESKQNNPVQDKVLYDEFAEYEKDVIDGMNDPSGIFDPETGERIGEKTYDWNTGTWMQYGGMPMANTGYNVSGRRELFNTMTPEQKRMLIELNKQQQQKQQRGSGQNRGMFLSSPYGGGNYRRGVFNTMMGINAPAAIRRSGQWLSPWQGASYASGLPALQGIPAGANLQEIDIVKRGLFERMFPGKDAQGNRLPRGPKKSIKYTFNVPGSTTPGLTTEDDKISNFNINTDNRPDFNKNNQNTTYDDLDQKYDPNVQDPTYQQQIEGDGSEYDAMIMNDAANRANQEDQAEGTPKKRWRDKTKAERRGWTETAPGKFIDRRGNLRSAEGRRRMKGTEGMTETAPGKFIDSEGALVSRRGSAPTTMSADPGWKDYGTEGFEYNPGFDPNTFKETKSKFDEGNLSRRELRKMGFKRKERQAYEEDPAIATSMRRERMRANRQYGGFQEGDEVYMTPDQVAQFMAAGGQIEFL